MTREEAAALSPDTVLLLVEEVAYLRAKLGAIAEGKWNTPPHKEKGKRNLSPREFARKALR